MPTVWIIDDDIVTQSILLRALNRQGITNIEILSHGGEALSRLESNAFEAPDLVFIDICMPVLDGANTLQALRYEVPSAYLVMFSAFDEKEIIEQAKQHGAHDYMVKPVNESTLKKVLKSFDKRVAAVS